MFSLQNVLEIATNNVCVYEVDVNDKATFVFRYSLKCVRDGKDVFSAMEIDKDEWKRCSVLMSRQITTEELLGPAFKDLDAPLDWSGIDEDVAEEFQDELDQLVEEAGTWCYRDIAKLLEGKDKRILYSVCPKDAWGVYQSKTLGCILGPRGCESETFFVGMVIVGDKHNLDAFAC